MKRLKIITPLILMCFTISFSGMSRADGDSFVLLPAQFVSVKGDVAKFRAINWMNDGYTGGIKDMTIERKLGKDVTVSFEGNATSDNSMAAKLILTKDNVGYFKIDYGTFRKWFDNVGGNYPAYTTLKVNSLENSDLHLDMGHLILEAGTGPVNDPTLSLTYERDTKNGNKDRLSWVTVYDKQTGSGSNYSQKKIAPSWEGMDQTTDALTLKSKTDVKGVTVKTQNSYEFYDANNTREYKGLATDGTASHMTTIRQVNTPQTKLLTSTILADRWSVNDQTYVSFGYHYLHNRSNEGILIRTYDNTTNALVAGTDRFGGSLNFQDTNTWTGQLMHNLTQDLSFISKFKGEIITRTGSGDYYNTSKAPQPDGSQTWNTLDANSVENKIFRTGESVSLRYNGIPKTSLYSEFEMQQERNWLTEARNQIALFPGASTASLSREEIARNPTFVETIGARFVPTKKVNMTSQYKHTFGGQTFNTLYKTDTSPASSGEQLNRQSFFNKLNIDKDEVASKITWKPFTWLENSFKNKLVNYVYHTNLVSEDWEKDQMSERDFMYDLTLIPNENWMFNLSYSIQQLKASTRQAQTPDYWVSSSDWGVQIPPFTANVYSWMFSTSYAPKDNFSVFQSVEYSRAKNPNNADTILGTSSGTPYSQALRYGVDDQWWDMTLGCKWSPKKNLSIEPHYAFYSFRAGQSVESGNYSANVIYVDLKYNW